MMIFFLFLITFALSSPLFDNDIQKSVLINLRSSNPVNLTNCPSNCLTCSASICFKCQEKFILFSGTCLQSCPSGYYLVSAKCQPDKGPSVSVFNIVQSSPVKHILNESAKEDKREFEKYNALTKVSRSSQIGDSTVFSIDRINEPPKLLATGEDAVETCNCLKYQDGVCVYKAARTVLVNLIPLPVCDKGYKWLEKAKVCMINCKFITRL